MASDDAETVHSFSNETPGVSGVLEIVVNERLGLIKVHGSGFWSVSQVKAHFARYMASLAELHRRGLKLSIIVDLREAAPQSREVSDVLHNIGLDIYRPDDRIAMVVVSSLVKMQMRRVLVADNHEFFLSVEAAERWALAYKQAPPSSAGLP
jgi:hypothetical protein